MLQAPLEIASASVLEIIVRAMLLRKIVSLAEADEPLELVELPVTKPQPGEILLQVSVCGVCHTELDEIEGRTPPPRLPIIPGHQVVGRVAELGAGVTAFRVGDRVGVGWIHRSCGGPRENLSPDFRATGRDANGGYAEWMTVPDAYAYPIPEVYTDEQAAPLLCAGAVGYRSLKLTEMIDGDPLGLTGFGGSAHLVLQMAKYLFPNSPVFVFAHQEVGRAFARQSGADWAGETSERAPTSLRAIIDTTPAWKPVVEALANLRPGGRLVINAIRKEDRDKDYLLRLSYQEHLWMEREIKTVANVTSADLAEFLPLAARAGIRPTVELYPLADANRAIIDLKRKPVQGSKVLVVSTSTSCD